VRRGLLILVLCVGVVGLGGAALLVRGRLARCAAVPLLADDRLPPIDFARLAPGGAAGVALPEGWSGLALGVQVGDFTVSGKGHSFQLIGIANALQTPAMAVRPGETYCVAAQALADSLVSGTRLRAAFHWLDQRGAPLAEDRTDWQVVRRWQGPEDRGGWSRVVGVFRAPAGADRLVISFHPASDDRIYLDDIHVRPALDEQRIPPAAAGERSPVTVAPWPHDRAAALSFSFDWETAMGGLIHSRSVDDPNGDQDPLVRAMRMRQGITTTLALFRPYGIRATYYANGYNFLLGNTARRTFMNNPTFAWADSRKPHSWPTDHWKTTPWFSVDPYGTVASDPQWYFGDLVPVLQREHQDIQSHTFSHLYGGFAQPSEWRADLSAWKTVAAERGVAPARSLAFPWSGSGGMSYANWDELEAAGISSVTRTSKQAQYQIASERDPHCRPVPGHERILACPDFYLHSVESAAQALKLIDQTIAVSGTLDLWAHTEEVVAPEQIAVWSQVVGYAAQQRDAGKLWIAPLAEIADWQQALQEVRVTHSERDVQDPESPMSFTITNNSRRDLSGVTLRFPFSLDRYTLDGRAFKTQNSKPKTLELDIRAGQTREVVAWPT
jgi:hypothetical protein